FEKEAGATIRYAEDIKFNSEVSIMATRATQMNIIVEKTKKLIQLCEALQVEDDVLKLEVQSLQVAFQTSTDKDQQLEEKLKALAVAKSLEESEVDREAINEKILDTKQKIIDFVREIDRCIGLLK